MILSKWRWKGYCKPNPVFIAVWWGSNVDDISQALVDTTKVNMPHKRQPQDGKTGTLASSADSADCLRCLKKWMFLAHSGFLLAHYNRAGTPTVMENGAKLNSFRNPKPTGWWSLRQISTTAPSPPCPDQRLDFNIWVENPGQPEDVWNTSWCCSGFTPKRPEPKLVINQW